MAVATKKDMVMSFMKKNRKYIPGSMIAEATGDTDLRRLRELRQDGLNIQKRRNADGEYEYRLGK